MATIQLTDTSRLVISQDEDAHNDNPRDWTPSIQQYTYAAAYLSHAEDDMSEATGAAKVWAHFYDQTGDNWKALEIARRWIRIVGSTERIDLYSARGYSQGDWWDLVTVVPSDEHGEPDSYAKTWEMWARGDVWNIDLERAAKYVRLREDDEGGEVDYDDEHIEWEMVESIGGTYMDPGEEDTAIVTAFEHWDLTDEEKQACIEKVPALKEGMQ